MKSESDVGHDAIGGAPYLGGIEAGRPRVVGIQYGLVHSVVGQVFGAGVKAEVLKPKSVLLKNIPPVGRDK